MGAFDAQQGVSYLNRISVQIIFGSEASAHGTPTLNAVTVAAVMPAGRSLAKAALHAAQEAIMIIWFFMQLMEDLEQLKVLENGYKMKVVVVDHCAHGVDVPSDVDDIIRIMREQGLQ